MTVLYFAFFKIIEGIEIDTKIRVSTWLETNDSYLMPCQFKEVFNEGEFFRIKVEILDPNRFIDKKIIGKKFLFGHPGKIIGYGIVKEIF